MKTHLLFHHEAGQTVILILVGKRREVFLGLLFNVKGCHYVIDLNGSKKRVDELTSRLKPSSLKCSLADKYFDLYPVLDYSHDAKKKEWRYIGFARQNSGGFRRGPPSLFAPNLPFFNIKFSR